MSYSIQGTNINLKMENSAFGICIMSFEAISVNILIPLAF